MKHNQLQAKLLTDLGSSIQALSDSVTKTSSQTATDLKSLKDASTYQTIQLQNNADDNAEKLDNAIFALTDSTSKDATKMQQAMSESNALMSKLVNHLISSKSEVTPSEPIHSAPSNVLPPTIRTTSDFVSEKRTLILQPSKLLTITPKSRLKMMMFSAMHHIVVTPVINHV